jgi:hypothetical protein
LPQEPDHITADGDFHPEIKSRVPDKKGGKTKQTAKVTVAMGSVGKAIAALATPAAGCGGVAGAQAPPRKRQRGIQK